MTTGGGSAGISIRQVFGRGQGVRHGVAFFDSRGTVVNEVDLPPDASPLSYAPVSAKATDTSGRRNWVVALSDGTILVFSPLGEELARHASGLRLRAILAIPQQTGPDLLVAATHRGLTAWRLVPASIRPRG
jgi:hypothetical protein